MADALRIFFDTEFTSLTEDAKLISIGIIDQSGQRTFYAELTDTWLPEEAGDYTQTEVIPLLQGGQYRMTLRELGEQFADWLASFNRPVVLATDSLQWDWRWIKTVFEHHSVWPQNLSPEPLLLTMNYLCNYDPFVYAVEKAFSEGLRRHHALDDAKANRLGWIASGGDIILSHPRIGKV